MTSSQPDADVVAAEATAIARRGARRRNTSDAAGRVHATLVRMTTDEKALVTALALSQGLSVPAFLMRSAVTGGADAAARYERLREELAGARRLLAGLSSNLNQLARQANAHALAEDVPAVTVAQLDSAVRAVQQAVSRVDSITSRAAPAQGRVHEQ